MPTVLVYHEVDDVDHWLGSPKRAEAFAAIGGSVREFRDPQGTNRVGLIAEVPDRAALEEFLQSDQAAEAMKHDGVRPETLLLLEESS
jgi:hypothetical protein